MTSGHAPARVHPETAVEAAGYIRVSRKVQAEGHSPEVQRAAIKRLATQEGFILADDMIEEDHERGSKVSRAGYQRIIEAVRAGRVHAVLVFMFDRWGRDGTEWLTRAREFERLHVPIISVQEGKDEGGLMRFIRAGMAEEYSRQLAKRVLPAREKAAREGVFMGPAPLGYRRVYPEWDGRGRRPHGRLLADEATAWVVRELFARYAAGGCSLRSLADWLQSEARVPKRTDGYVWTRSSITGLLHNPVYIGLVRYNHRPCGYYERAAAGSMFTAPGLHEALIDAQTFAAVQRRLAAGRTRPSYNHGAGKRVLLGAGLLTCAACGGPMEVCRKSDGKDYYQCAWRWQRRAACTARAFLAALAHAALLRQIGRLRGAPWTPQAERRLTGDGRDVDKAVALQRGLDAERARLRKHTLLMTALEDDPTPEQIAVFREVSADISGRIRSLDEQIAAVGDRAAHVPTLREMHARLATTELGPLLEALGVRGDVLGQRALIQDIVAAARVVERRPQSHPTWLRVDVTWTPDVQTLLDAGPLTLDAADAGPPPLAPKEERQRQYERSYKERHRDAINARRRQQRATARALRGET